jgi:hypothetical protein
MSKKAFEHASIAVTMFYPYNLFVASARLDH